MTDVLVATGTRAINWFQIALLAVVLALSVALGVALATRTASAPVRTGSVQVSHETCVGHYPMKIC